MTTTPANPPATALPEVRETEATGEIAQIYDEIRRTAGVAQVNLIYRHLATRPDVLAWAWQTLAPAFRSGRIAEAASALVSRVPGDGDGPLWESPGATLDPSEAQTLRDVLAFYNRGNPQNIIALTALVSAARRGNDDTREAATTTTADAPSWATPGTDFEPSRPIPPLPRRDSLPAATVALIDALAHRQSGGAGGVTPSMYLHLALWPSALAATELRIAPLLATPEFARRVAAVITDVEVTAGTVAASLMPPSPRPSAESLDPMLATISRFVGGTIPEMIVVGAILTGRAAP